MDIYVAEYNDFITIGVRGLQKDSDFFQIWFSRELLENLRIPAVKSDNADILREYWLNNLLIVRTLKNIYSKKG